MRPSQPPGSHLDLAVAALSGALLLLSLTSASAVLYLRLRTYRSRHRLRGLNALWPVRLLLVLFATVWPLSELARLPQLRPHLSCRAYILSSYAFAEPCFLATLLFLIRTTTHPNPAAASASAALAGALLSALPFLALHAVFLVLHALALRRLGLPLDAFGRTRAARCRDPLFGAVLLAALGAVYVPLFVSAGWGAVSVVINKRLRGRLYALVAAVVTAISVQVAALALAAIWQPGDAVAQWLGFVAFVAVFACVAVGEVILVVLPVVDSLAVEGSGRGEDGRQACIAAAREDLVG